MGEANSVRMLCNCYMLDIQTISTRYKKNPPRPEFAVGDANPAYTAAVFGVQWRCFLSSAISEDFTLHLCR